MGSRVANSLFASVKTDTPTEGQIKDKSFTETASIRNFRHLENLDPAVSDVIAVGAKVGIAAGLQTSDLDWELFHK